MISLPHIVAFALLGTVAVCQTQNTNLNVNLLSHLGNSESQLIPAAVSVLPDGTTLVACNALDTAQDMFTFGDSDFFNTINFVSISDDISNIQSLIIAIERANDGNNNEYTITSILGLGANNIDDIASNDNYHIVAVGSFGLIGVYYDNCNNIFDIKFIDNNDTYVNNCDDSYDCRVAIGKNDNTFVGYFGQDSDGSGWLTNVFEWSDDSEANIILTQSLSKTSLSDVAIDTDNSLVFRIGYHQESSNLQVTYVFATDYTGNSDKDYALYNWGSGDDLSNDGSDTRGISIKYTDNNNLWLLGRADGGTSIFSHLPNDLSANANNIGFDSYTQTFNTGSSAQTYYARLVSSNGTFIRGQFMLNRLSSSSGNTLRPVAIATDTNEEFVYIAHVGACCAENRDDLTINGTQTGGYGGTDGLLCIVSYDLQTRYYWTVFTQYDSDTNYKSNSIDVASNNGVTSFVGYVESGGSVIEISAFDGTTNHASDDSGFIVIIDNYYGTEDSGLTTDCSDSGDNGDTVDNGDNGDSGDSDSSGDSGNNDDSGSSGDNGDNGDNGDTGDNGDNGGSGDTGNSDDSGTSGENESSSETDNSGDTGDGTDESDTGDDSDNSGESGGSDVPNSSDGCAVVMHRLFVLFVMYCVCCTCVLC